MKVITVFPFFPTYFNSHIKKKSTATTPGVTRLSSSPPGIREFAFEVQPKIKIERLFCGPWNGHLATH